MKKEVETIDAVIAKLEEHLTATDEFIAIEEVKTAWTKFKDILARREHFDS